MVTLGLSYMGNGRNDDEAKRLALAERKVLERIASDFRVELSCSGPFHFTFSTDSARTLPEVRKSLVDLSREDKLHYFQLFPIKY